MYHLKIWAAILHTFPTSCPRALVLFGHKIYLHETIEQKCQTHAFHLTADLTVRLTAGCVF